MTAEPLEPAMAEIELFDGALAARHQAMVRAWFVISQMQDQIREAVIDRFFNRIEETTDVDDSLPSRLGCVSSFVRDSVGDGKSPVFPPVPPYPSSHQPPASTDGLEPTSALTEPRTDDMRRMVEDLRENAP